MKSCWLFIIALLVASGSIIPLSAQATSENAALRYWVAFAQMQDIALSEPQAKEIAAILDGAPYDGFKYKELIAKNHAALDGMARATSLPHCDWNLEYKLGADLPMEYARKGLALGRLNVLYALQLSKAGATDKAVRVVTAGLRFSQDLTAGGSLFVALAGKTLITAHLMAMRVVLASSNVAPEHRAMLRTAIALLGEDGPDWQSATKRDLAGLATLFPHDVAASDSLARIAPAYLVTLDTPSGLVALNALIEKAPPTLRSMIPDPGRLLRARQELRNALKGARNSLQ
jgi:hypothetical protein